MVLVAGMSATDRIAYEAKLCTNQRMRTIAQIWDLDHNPLIDVSMMFEDGQTNIDGTQQISRSATLSLFDPTRVIGFDTANPSDGSVSPKYMLHKKRGVYVESLSQWIDVPVFTGPITTPTRDGDMLSIVANGKEQLALNKAWVTLNVKKGTNKAVAIQTILAAVGESFFRIAQTDATLSADVAVTREDTHWDVAKKIADGLGWLMFYDAEGYLVARPQSTTPVWNFLTGNGGSIRSAWQIGYSSDGVYNLVFATGGTPSGKTDPISAYAIAGGADPLAPLNLGRGSPKQPQYLRYDVSDDTLTKVADVQALADKTLPQVLLDSVSIAFESLPVPHLEEGDAVQVTDAETGVSTSTTMRTWSIPDSSGATQSNGFLRRVSRSPRVLKKAIR